MKTTQDTTRSRVAPAPGLRVAMMLLAALALAVGFATAKAETMAPDAKGWSGYEDMPYRVNVWHDRGEDEVYQRGEDVRIHFECNHDAYAVVYRVDAEGYVEILWPRSRYDDGFVFGHHTYNLPTPGADRIRAADSEGVEYVQALVSAYPFDLRGLDVDFHHENESEAREYYVAGDPFLAMNDINFAVTGLEDAEDYVATNYVSYYVHRAVDHPRYMCLQCHEDGEGYDPYDDVCVIEIHHDYGWDNEWFDRYHYYPVYYYPAYYYVDPWTWRPWLNYWYRPWYAWPHWGYSSWGFDCYVWNYSPYYRGDMWVRYKDGHRRYRPIVKDRDYAGAAGGGSYRHPDGLVKTPRPTDEMVASMERRADQRKEATKGVTRGGTSPKRDQYTDTGRTSRTTTGFTREDRKVTAPGLRMPVSVDRGSGETERKAVTPTVRTGRRGSESSSTTTRSGTVRTVDPKTQGERIWSGSSRETTRESQTVKPSTRRSSASSGTTVKPSTRRSSTSSGTTVKPSTRSSSGTTTKAKSSGSSTRQKSTTPKSSSRKSSSSSSRKSVKSSSSGSGSSGAARSSGSSSSRSGSRGSSQKGSSRGRG